MVSLVAVELRLVLWRKVKHVSLVFAVSLDCLLVLTERINSLVKILITQRSITIVRVADG
jgi:hypothetical protein